MKGLVLALCVVLMGTIAQGKEAEKKPTFKTLVEAVTFIAGCLEKDDSKKLSSACLKEPMFFEDFFKELKTRHKTKALSELYKEREFPADTKFFKLGGHRRELGCIHINFMKNRDGWVLASFLKCK